MMNGQYNNRKRSGDTSPNNFHKHHKQLLRNYLQKFDRIKKLDIEHGFIDYEVSLSFHSIQKHQNFFLGLWVC